MKPEDKQAAAIALRQAGLFAPLEPAALAALAARARPRRFEAGTILFREGSPCAGVFVIASGTVRIFKLAGNGRELTLHLANAPTTVAEVPLVDGGAYPASVEAVAPVQAYFLPRADFLAVCSQHPEIALATLAMFGQRLRGLVGLLEQVTFGSVRQRLARWLLDEAAPRDGQQVCRGTHQQLAASLGTVREVISRNLSRFQADGLVRIEPRQVVVVDAAGLAREAQTEV